jgi:hypothetical protein
MGCSAIGEEEEEDIKKYNVFSVTINPPRTSDVPSPNGSVTPKGACLTFW